MINKNKPGFDYEANMGQIFSHSLRKYPGLFQDVRGTDEDILRGTDYIINTCRVDFTMYFQGKDNVIQLPEVIALKNSGVDLKLGIRTGNGKVKFEEPVLVIGIDLIPSVYRYLEERISEDIEKISDTLLDIMEDFYDLYPNYLRKEVTV